MGLTEETTCFVAAAYFSEEAVRRLRRARSGSHLPQLQAANDRTSRTGRREWLLDIDYRKRETFAYACEAYSRVLALGNSLAARRVLLSEIEEGPVQPDDRVDPVEYIDILREAIAVRNGWKANPAALFSSTGAAVSRGWNELMTLQTARRAVVGIATYHADPLCARIECAVNAILAKGNIVAPVNVMIGMDLLRPDQLEQWRRGQGPGP